jgi:hypothetical protein
MSTNEDRIQAALMDCQLTEDPDFTEIASKHLVDRTTLSRRFNGTQRSYFESRSESIQCLNNHQEDILIDFINRLTIRSLPPTSQIVKNVVEELCNRHVGKNWVGQFTKRHSNQLHSGYLRSIDNKRLNAENLTLMEMFYTQVSAFRGILII